MSNNNQSPVCIIGAGVAGLAAARCLQKADVPFVVVEGSQRIGGRVFPFEHDGGFLQHGATFVNGDKNKIYEIARNEDLIVDSVGDFDLFSQFSDIHTEETNLTIEDKADFASFVSELEDKYSDISEENPNLSVKEAFQKDYDRFIQTSPHRQSLRSSFDALARFYLSYYEMEWAASCDKMALANFSVWDDDSETRDESFSLDSRGYKRIIDVLVEEIPKDRIRLGATVTSVNYENQEFVTVTFEDEPEEDFASVIVTSSLGFLKKYGATLFTPSLPERKLKAIETLGFGDMQKIFLQYENPFWKEEEKAIKTIGPSSSPLLGRGNLFEVVEWSPQTLTMWLSGRAVDYASKRSDEQLMEEITIHLRKALGNDSIEQPKKIMRHCWKQDPLVLGSYSYLTPEAVMMGGANECLARPILSTLNEKPLICFAGEATHSSFYQTTCGAFLSGEREALRIIKRHL